MRPECFLQINYERNGGVGELGDQRMMFPMAESLIVIIINMMGITKEG